jgi:hypothetical protein
MTHDFMDVVHLLWQQPKKLYEIIENIQKIVWNFTMHKIAQQIIRQEYDNIPVNVTFDIIIMQIKNHTCVIKCTSRYK